MAAVGWNGPASAQAPTSLEASRNRLVEFVAANPGCKEMSDGCQICVIGAGGRPECSSPGIACQPVVWQCKTSTAPKADSEPSRKR